MPGSTAKTIAGANLSARIYLARAQKGSCK